MSQYQPKPKNDEAPLNDAVERGKLLVQEGNARRVVVRSGDGSTLFDVSLTVAVVGAGILTFLIPGGIVLMLLAAVVGIAAKVRIDILREINDDDATIMIDQQSDER